LRADDVTDLLEALVLHLRVVEEVKESPLDGSGGGFRSRNEELRTDVL
jgi:hypothetical protein